MTLASRVQVFTQLSCNIVHGHDKYDHTDMSTLRPTLNIPSLEYISPQSYFPKASTDMSLLQTFVIFENGTRRSTDGSDPPTLPDCSKDPAVQSVAARLQTVMAMTVGTLCALSTGWWGHFGERHGRTKVLAAATLGLLFTSALFRYLRYET